MLGKHIKKMTARKITYLILILFTLISCKNDSTTDEKVLSELFPQLIDSLRISKTNLIPPPPPPIYDKDSNFIGTDSVTAKQIVDKQNELLRQIDSMDSRLLIGLVDSFLTIDFDDLEQRTYSDSLILRQIIANNSGLKNIPKKWDLDLINIPEDYQLRYKSDLELKYPEIWRINDRKFGGLIAVSRIYFDSEGNNGLLQFETFPFYHEGASYFVIIELIDNKWEVKRILMNWIT